MRTPRLVATLLTLGLLAGTGCTRHPSSAAGAGQRTSPDVQAAGGGPATVSPQAFGGATGGPTAAAPNVRSAPASSGPAHASASSDDHSIGNPTALGNLVVFPVTSRSQVDVLHLAASLRVRAAAAAKLGRRAEALAYSMRLRAPG